VDGVRLTEKGRDWLAMGFCLLVVFALVIFGLIVL
jgi:hypothetical protein